MHEVTVLLSTYNGEKYLQEQLDSLYAQKNVNVKIFVRDDGSTDSTKQILEKNAANNKLTWYGGKNLKPAFSFMDLLKNAPPSEYYAFCDQDDIWLSDKLSIAVKSLEGISKEVPALYYGHPRLVDSEKKALPSSPRAFHRFTTFYSMLINSNATGCTMVFNQSLARIANGKSPSYMAMHDGWIHKLCIIAKGKLIYDEDVHILYRQHGGNVIGGTSTPTERIISHYKSLKNADCIRSKTIASLLECYGYLMTDEELDACKKIVNYKKSVRQKMSLLFDRRIKTDYPQRNRLYKLAVLLGIF